VAQEQQAEIAREEGGNGAGASSRLVFRKPNDDFEAINELAGASDDDDDDAASEVGSLPDMDNVVSSHLPRIVVLYIFVIM
jgi:hypothetical protein